MVRREGRPGSLPDLILRVLCTYRERKDFMKSLPIALLFIAGAALSWGLYVPAIHTASSNLKSSLRGFLLVGLAYFLVAVLIPAFFIFVLKNDPTARGEANFDPKWVTWGIFAGILGAAGALCVIFATKYAPGGPLIVAPLVFAGAPIINTIATVTYFHRVNTLPDWRFFLGLALAAGGAAMVMVFKPVDKPTDDHKPTAAVQQSETVSTTSAS
jgi:drug/metabolite transporter (DMT)-like permease